VVAPSLIPVKPGDRVTTNRLDAVALAKLLRAGDLTAVWVPDEGHEAMPDLVRARSAAVETLRVQRQQVSAFMLKHGRVYPRKKGWTTLADRFRRARARSFSQCGHRSGGGRAKRSSMARLMAGMLGCGGGPRLFFFRPPCLEAAGLKEGEGHHRHQGVSMEPGPRIDLRNGRGRVPP
jgi:hypothetical protein